MDTVDSKFGKCQCGCGGITSINTRNRKDKRLVKGQPKRFIHGHQHRGQVRGAHPNRKRPYEVIYNRLVHGAAIRSLPVSLTYEEFVELTKQATCEYCGVVLVWVKHRSTNNRELILVHNIDRKDNTLGYTKGNSVVCCARCNRGKGYSFTYEEWLAMTAVFKGGRLCQSGQQKY